MRQESFGVNRLFSGRLAGVRLIVAAVAGGTAVLLVHAADGVWKGATGVLAAPQLAARVAGVAQRAVWAGFLACDEPREEC